MEEIWRIKYIRAIVPHDANNLDIVTLDAGNASSKLICCAIYARFEINDCSYSCQLVFSRSKLLENNTLRWTNGCKHECCYRMHCEEGIWELSQKGIVALQTLVRNRVVWRIKLRYVESSNMVADLGTRKKAKIMDVMEGSNWINGLSWLSKPQIQWSI